MRIMGLDYGSVTVGVAISDPLLLTAQGIEVIQRKQENKLRRTLARIEELIKEYEVTKIVVGYPKNMNNSIGDRAKKTEEFAEILRKRTNLEVILWDERLTTVSADNVLTEGGLSLKKKESVIDMIAAVFILQGYLDKLYNQKDNGKETERYE
ncbi:putative Holliday junction resolvase [Herbinix hemicellulosilytica]|uniref:Putative pre-16S rRNA nuclease n=1 Tax=Herbinix hemicellulosilytica TaxID=1564487 RepID=A0A0H5SEF1_HERHM|nr:Holliday junction resolvase RuvX [Herbinix hemicellulosilytica]RBP60093.1 putative Holliday junction resolvase [Herbinix hemicellulosilytica]CRZ33817.1 putative Holliday junction resolvase [Herbinix hemicellulosilytica]